MKTAEHATDIEGRLMDARNRAHALALTFDALADKLRADPDTPIESDAMDGLSSMAEDLARELMSLIDAHTEQEERRYAAALEIGGMELADKLKATANSYASSSDAFMAAAKVMVADSLTVDAAARRELDAAAAVLMRGSVTR